jgi:tetratricopeptide (TPR) repeat protein
MARAAALGDLVTLRTILVRAQADPLFMARELPELPSRKVEAGAALPEVEASFSRLVEEPGGARLLNAWVGLGRVRHRLGRYPAAASAYREALRLNPQSQAARAGLALAERADLVSARLVRMLPQAARILAVSPLEGLWAAVYYTPGDGRTGSDFTRVRAGLYREHAGELRPVGPPLPLRDPRYDDAYRDVRVFARDLTGDGRDEVSVELKSLAASSDPACLLVLTPHRGGWKQLLRLTSTEDLWLEDLDADGKYEVGSVYEIGCRMSHAEQPRWTDLYGYAGDRYVLANRCFPGEFREWPTALNEMLQVYPDDWEILDYLGRTQEILGRPVEARDCYRRAAGALLPEFRQAGGTPGYPEWLRGRQKVIRKRLAALETSGSRPASNAIGSGN